jgi:hypothetical protein
VLLFASLFAIAFSRKRFLYAPLLSGFKVKGMPLHFLNDVLLLDFPFEPT